MWAGVFLSIVPAESLTPNVPPTGDPLWRKFSEISQNLGVVATQAVPGTFLVYPQISRYMSDI